MSSTAQTIESQESARAQSLWGAVRESLAGAHGRDFTEGPIGRAIFILAVPMVLEMMMARRIGEKDPEGAAHTAAQVVLFGLVLSLLIGLLGALFAPQLLVLMGAS